MTEIEQVDVSSSTNAAVFYSGPGNCARAEAFITNGDFVTLQSTTGGSWLDNETLFKRRPVEDAQRAWDRLSQRYADQASGSVNAFIDGSTTRGTFFRVKYEALIQNPNVHAIMRNGVQPIQIRKYGLN